MPPLLNHSRVTAPGVTPERWIFVLHGIYGRGRNWASIARRLADTRPEWGSVLVDLRHHGESMGFEGPHTLEESAADLGRLAAELGVAPAAVLGHSFGGKVALRFARDAPAGLRQVWVIDSTPETREPSGSAWGMIRIIRGMPDRFASRAEFVDRLAEHGYAPPVGQWMAMNLEPTDDGFRWRIDFDVMEALLRDFFRTDLWSVVEDPPAGVEVHLVKAEESSVLTEDAAERIGAAGRGNGRAFLHRVAGGHWVNTENPEAVLGLLTEGLP